MPNRESGKGNLWTRLKRFVKTNTSLTILIMAALLLELTSGIVYYTSQRTIDDITEFVVKSEMEVLSLSIRDHLARVEVTLDNMSWVVTEDMDYPDSLFSITYNLVKYNPAILGSSISCIPNLYPMKGYWFEPYAARREDGTIESMQLGSEKHDYTKAEFFTKTIAMGSSFWTEPYMDEDGARAVVTSYSSPVRDRNGKISAVVEADISLDWLDGIMNEGNIFKLTKRYLVTGKHTMLAGNDSLTFNAVLKLIKEDNGEDEFLTMYDEEGREKRIFYSPIGGKTDWIVIVAVDELGKRVGSSDHFVASE